ncbi:MAG TPA: hypothetical protein VLC09_11935 [Polyangiaceae bacterium]|nr:hypothetical protein [Polyangiaceae bacterium]
MPAYFQPWFTRIRRLPAHLWVVLGLIVLAALLRTLGYFGGDNGLWNDEANWVLRMAKGQSGGGIRPPAYVWLNKVLIAWHPSEAALRSSSWIAGLASVPLFYAVARRAGLDRITTAFGLFLLAIHPWAVAYAKEWKPYGLELTAHLVVAVVTYGYARRPSWKSLLVLAGTCAASVLFAWSVVFQFPGIFLLAVATQYRSRNWKQLGLTGGVALAGAIGIVAMHHDRLGRMLRGGLGSSKFWGEKYGVFYLVKGDTLGKLRWQAEQSWNLARFPYEVKAFWDESGHVSHAFGIVGGTLALAGIVVLCVRRNGVGLAIWVLPWLMTLVANWLGLWPYGVFRTNVYLLIYPLWLGLYTVSSVGTWLAQRKQVAWYRNEWLAPALALVVALPFVPYDLHYFRYKDVATNAYSSSLGRSLATIRANTPPGQRVQVLLDGYACGTAQYYLKYHPEFKELGPWFRKYAHMMCSNNSVADLSRRVMRLGARPSWVITARPLSAEPMLAFLRKHCHLDYSADLPTPDTLTLCRPK